MQAPYAQRWEQVLLHAFDAIALLDEAGCVVQWNAQAEKSFGWQAHEIIGRLLCDAIFSQATAATFQKDWCALRQAARQSPPSPHRRVLLDVSALHRTGHPIALDISLTLPAPGDGSECLLFMRDVTERREADNALRIASVAFQSLEGMAIMDAGQKILKVNQAFTEITGYEEREATGRLSAIFRPDRQDDEVYAELRRVLPEKRFWQGEVWDRRKNGERYSAWLRVTAVADGAGAVSHYVAAFVDTSTQRASAQRLHYLDFHDPLTSLPNRRYFLDRLRQSLAAGERKGEHCAVLLIDLDDFKAVNDTLGHSAGDTLLVKLGKRLRMGLHAEDTIARLGGDEFAVILQGLTGGAQAAATKAKTVADRLIDGLSHPFHIAGTALDVCLSIGISLSDCQDASAEDLLKEADIAMYRAKHDGRNCVRFFDTANQASLESRFLLTAAMRSGLPDQFQLHYQLQVGPTGEPLGVEALARWTHPTLGAVSPATFIPLAEENGFVVAIGAWALEQACAQLKAWASKAHTRHLSIAVNVSARQFHAEGFSRTVIDTLARFAINPNFLKLELTEGIMLNHMDAAVQKMELLRKFGVRFSLDDFGTGYSSLSYLKRLPLEQLKIDQSFVRDLETDPNDVAIASAIVAMGKSLGLEVVAEGVENPRQYEILRAMGCNAFQGYLFARPLSIHALQERLLPSKSPAPSGAQPIEKTIEEAL